MSQAYLRELRRQVIADSEQQPSVSDDVREWLDNYVPRNVSAPVWATVRPRFIEVLLASENRGLEACKRRSSVLASYLGWCLQTGFGLGPAAISDEKTIAAYCRTLRGQLDDASVSTLHARLRKLTAAVDPTPTPKVTYGYTPVKPPCTAQEEAAVRRAVLRYHSLQVRPKLCLIVGACGGAGLDASDVVRLRGDSITDLGTDGIRVDVPGSRARTTWVRRDYEEVMRVGLMLVTSRKALLFGPRNSGRNAVGALIEKATFHGHVPHIEAARMRSTWLVWALTRNLPLPLVMKAAGLSSARTLAELVEYVTVEVGGEELR